MSDTGFTHKVKGKSKETVGNVTGDSSVKAEVVLDQVVGKAKEVASDINDVVQRVPEKAKYAINSDSDK